MVLAITKKKLNFIGRVKIPKENAGCISLRVRGIQEKISDNERWEKDKGFVVCKVLWSFGNKRELWKYAEAVFVDGFPTHSCNDLCA